MKRLLSYVAVLSWFAIVFFGIVGALTFAICTADGIRCYIAADKTP